MEFENVGTTAYVIAGWRAEEANHPNPICMDHLANIFLNDEMRILTAKVAKASPSTAFLVKFRTRYFDDLILSTAQNDFKQVVILGSGLDTRAIRLAHPQIKFFEIDQKHVLEFKRNALAQHGYLENSAFIACDYTVTNFIDLLLKNNINFKEKTCILWEGNIFYLPYQTAVNVLQTINQNFYNVEIVFDYLSKKLIAQETGYQKSNDLLDSFKSMGAAWQTGIEDINSLAKETGYNLKQNTLIAQYINKNFPFYPVDESLLDDYYICTFQSNRN